MLDILAIRRGTVVAPAGCGKTHLIAETLRDHSFYKPILVLTHTNAGVASLRQRLAREGVNAGRFRLATIDGWALRIVSTFPVRSGYASGPAPTRPNYREIRSKAAALLKGRHVNNIIKATYSFLMVDEYQDSSLLQHYIVGWLSNSLPTVLFADPLQAIFNFGDDSLPAWDQVLKYFPVVGELKEPWRWANANEPEFGRWLLEIRDALAKGQPLDLTKAPANVRFVELHGDGGDHQRLVDAARCRHRAPTEKVLVIGDSRSAESRHRVARSVPGIVAIEPVQLGDLIKFATNLDISSPDAIEEIIEFAGTVATNVGSAEMALRIRSLCAGTSRKPANEVEAEALRFCNDPTHMRVASLLVALTNQPGVRIFRPAVLRACIRALNLCAATPSLTFREAAVQMREQYRAYGRQLPQAAIGSTLLLKGLESDHVIVLNAGDLDARNLYVAITRASKSATICARSKILMPAPV